MKRWNHVNISFCVTTSLNRKEHEEFKREVSEQINIMLHHLEKNVKASPTLLKVEILSE